MLKPSINKIIVFLALCILTVCLFPVNYHLQSTVSCEFSVYSEKKATDLVKIEDQEFESFFSEVKFFSRSTGVTISKQTMKNGDILVWFKIEHDSPDSFIDMEFSVDGITGPIRYWKHEDYIKRSEYAGDDIKSSYKLKKISGTSVEHSQGPALFEFGPNKPSVFLSRTGRFKPWPVGLLKGIDCKQTSTVVFGTKSVKLRIFLQSTTNEFEEGFVIVSNTRLLDLENKRSQSFLVSHDLWKVKPMLYDGWWFSAQSGYFEGADGNCYYPNPGFYAAKSMLVWYCQLDNRLFYNLVLSNMKMAYESVRKEGFARMPIMPVYFSNMYGGFVEYLDTRFSTDGARFLVKCAKLLDSQNAKQTISKLAKYYADNFNDISIDIDGNGSMLISDYIFDSARKLQVHASLNHTICIINFMLEYEDVTGDTTYAWVVDKLVESLNKTYAKWRKPNGDLWYGYFPTIKNFSNDDYSYLTYNDLNECMQLLEKVRKCGSIGIAELLTEKRNYLESQGMLKKKQLLVLKGYKETDSLFMDGSSISH
jgi:hypothetical protein